MVTTRTIRKQKQDRVFSALESQRDHFSFPFSSGLPKTTQTRRTEESIVLYYEKVDLISVQDGIEWRDFEAEK